MEVEFLAGDQLALQVRSVSPTHGQVFATPGNLVSCEDGSKTPDEERLAGRGLTAYPQSLNLLALGITTLVSDQQPPSGSEGSAVVHLVDGPEAVNRLDSHRVGFAVFFESGPGILCFRRIGLHVLDPLVVGFHVAHLLDRCSIVFDGICLLAVSYTHLTLPTSDLV